MLDFDFGTLLNLPEIHVTGTEIDSHGNFLIYAESTKKGTICHVCGKEIDKPYGHDREVRIRHLPIFGRDCYIIMRFPRYQCTHCDNKPITTQSVSWRSKNSSHTKPFEKHILLSLINSTVEDVSLKNGVGYDAVEGILDKQIKTEVDWKEIQELHLLGVDEISLKKGHRDFVSIITSKVKDEIRILAVLKDKKKETVKEFFMSIPKRLRDSVGFVCTDMYDGFVNAVKEVFEGQVKVVIDRFHVAKLYRTDFDTIRKSEMRLLKERLSKEEYNELKNSMWILRKKELSHTAEELHVMKRLFGHSPLLASAYHLRNDLTAIFDTERSKPQALKKIKGWIRKVQRVGLRCFDDFIKTIQERMDDILNYFTHRYTSGFVEGLNNKIKVLKRRCYGILNIKHLFQRIHLDLAGYWLFS